MAQSKILIDTNTYLRIAQSIHPLLKRPFGEKDYCLYILPDLYEEYKKSSRLKSSFSWVENEEYRENRNCKLGASKPQKVEIQRAYEFILESSYDIDSSASRVDIKCLAYGLVLNYIVVTDDFDMIELGKLFNIEIIKTVDLLKLMLDEEFIDIEKIDEISSYLSYIKDLPKNYRLDFKRLFGRGFPVSER